LEQFETFDADSAAKRYDIPVELNDQVSQYIRAFQGPLRSHFTLWLARSARYIPQMREILVREGVPEDTVFLSLIESGFSTQAYSPARAAGPPTWPGPAQPGLARPGLARPGSSSWVAALTS